MSVIRIKKTENFVILHKGALEDPHLSFKAKGLWAYCVSRPNDWTFHVSHLATVSKEGEDAIYSAIKELIDNGYCQKVQKNIGGKFQKVDYEIFETCQIKEILPLRDFPRTEDPRAGNPPLLRIDSKLNIEKETKREREGLKPPAPPPPPQTPSDNKQAFGKYFRSATEEVEQLKKDFGKPIVEEYIERFNDWAPNNEKEFKKKKDHIACIRSWMRKDGCKKMPEFNSKHPESSNGPLNVFKPTTPKKSNVRPEVKADQEWTEERLRGTSFQRLGIVEMYDKYVDFPKVAEGRLYYGDHGYQLRFDSNLRKSQSPPKLPENLEPKS